MELFEAIRGRRSVRSFDGRAVDRLVLEQIVEAGVLAPTGMNRQTRRLLVIEDAEKMRALAAAVAEACGRGPDYDFYRPAALIVVSDRADDPNAASNCACAMQNMMLAAHGLGLGAVWVNQIGPVCDEGAVRTLLSGMGLDARQRVWAALALGHAAAQTEPVAKNRDVVQWA